MFEDIVKSKFEGVDVGDRDIASELKSVIMKAKTLGLDLVDDPDEEVVILVNDFFDEQLDTMAQMYLDTFNTDELMELIDFELTPLAIKKLRFQIKMQTFIAEKIQEKMFAMMARDEIMSKEGDEGFLHMLKDLEEDIKETQAYTWDSREDTEV